MKELEEKKEEINLKDETKEINTEQEKKIEVEKKNPLIEKIQAKRENKENSLLINKK